MAERQVFELLAHSLHAHAACKRRVNVERFLRDAGALPLRDKMERAHIVQPVGELDEQHANVLRHSEQEFAEVLCLLGPLRDKIEFLKLGQTFNEIADFRAKELV